MNENFEIMLNDVLTSTPIKTKAKHRAKARKSAITERKKLMELATRDYMTVGSSRYAVQTRKVPDESWVEAFPVICKYEEQSYVRRPHSSVRTSFVKKRSHKKVRQLPLDEFVGKGRKTDRIVDFIWEVL